ncbi:MAG TPA: hypothetical protein VFM18_05985, partial [Methanosarcina sp.]|nr:hypothetical protein [Methanosarcina sp.]
MTLEEGYNFLNFWVNKYQNSYYTPEELDLIVDRASMSMFSQLRPQYSTSQRMHEALAPFLESYDFDTGSFVSGILSIPASPEFLALLDIQIQFRISNTTVYAGVQIINKDERANRLNSQIDPVTVTSPVAEVVGLGRYRLYPTAGGGNTYTGTVNYFRRPAKPNFVYTLISGRVVVFDENASTNLDWP